MNCSNKAVINNIFFSKEKLHSSEKCSENGNIDQSWVNFDVFHKSFA